MSGDKLNDQKKSEIFICESYLPAYTTRVKKSFRIDYQYVVDRPDGQYPDVLLFNLDNPDEKIGVEVTKAPDLEINERFETKHQQFMARFKKLVEQEGSKLKEAAISIDFNTKGLSDCSNPSDEAQKVFEKLNIEKVITDSLLTSSSSGFTDLSPALDNVKLDFGPKPHLAFSWSGSTLDEAQRVINAYTKKTNRIVEDKDTILLIYVDTDISDFYYNEISKFFSDKQLSFKEVWIFSRVIGGKYIFITE